MPDFLKKCPQCGRRSGVRKLETKLVSAQLERESIPTDRVVLDVQGGPGIINDGVQSVPLILEETQYERRYECERCHHLWIEKISRTD